MPKGGFSERKVAYFKRVQALFDEYPQALVVHADNVGAAQLQTIRKKLRQFDSVVLFGKNTMMRRALREHSATNTKLESLLPLIKGNMGFVLCKGHLKEVLEILENETVAAPAKSGQISNVDVIIPAGNTGLEPTQTSFLQALNIATKIVRSQIEILKEVHLLQVGVKVGSSEAALLDKLNIRPFSYGLEITDVYDDGRVYDAKVLKLSDDDIVNKFMTGVTRVASLSLAIGYPTLASLPHGIVNGYKNVVALALATDCTFDEVADLKAVLDDPEALAKAAAAAAATTADAAGGDAAEEKKEEAAAESSSSDEAMGGFDLFD